MLRDLWSPALQPEAHSREHFLQWDIPSLASIFYQCVICAAAALYVLAAPNDKAMCSRLHLALVLLSVGLPMAAAAAQGMANEKAGNDETSFDAAPPLVNASMIPLSRVTRRLAVINVQPGAGTLQAALNAASAGDELILANGTYTGSGTNVLDIGKTITIRALHTRGAILNGQSARRVVAITSGTVVLEGLDITGGFVTNVCKCAVAPFSNASIEAAFYIYNIRSTDAPLK